MNMKRSIMIKYLVMGISLGMLFIAEQYNFLNFRPSKDLLVPSVIRQPFDEVPEIIEVRDLLEIAYALELYKRDHQSYPVSSTGAAGWDGIVNRAGESREDWIEGLVPDYLKKLPRDPRMLEDYEHQYLYMSNGANYKLIAYNPSNCDLVERSYPWLIDPKRKGCQAYGFWTNRASRW